MLEWLIRKLKCLAAGRCHVRKPNINLKQIGVILLGIPVTLVTLGFGLIFMFTLLILFIGGGTLIGLAILPFSYTYALKIWKFVGDVYESTKLDNFMECLIYPVTFLEELYHKVN